MQLSKEEYARKRICNGCSVRIENSVALDNYLASLVMPNSYPRNLNLHLMTINNSYKSKRCGWNGKQCRSWLGAVWSGSILFCPDRYVWKFRIMITVLNTLLPSAPKRDLGTQCRPRSDTTEIVMWSGSTLFAINTGISIKINLTRYPNELESPRHAKLIILSLWQQSFWIYFFLCKYCLHCKICILWICWNIFVLFNCQEQIINPN